MKRTLLVARVVAGIAFALASGCCGGESAPATTAVRGKVVQSGKPLTGGTIEFQKLDEPSFPTDGAIGADGTFTLSTADPKAGKVAGAMPGEYRVVVLFAKDGDIPPPPMTLPRTYKIVAGENNITVELPAP